jgi:hypothetical protein
MSYQRHVAQVLTLPIGVVWFNLKGLHCFLAYFVTVFILCWASFDFIYCHMCKALLQQSFVQYVSSPTEYVVCQLYVETSHKVPGVK